MANIIVIAAASGIGQATVMGLRAAGHQVFTTARNADKLTPDAVVDATDFDAVDAAFAQAITAMGSIDGVVNCAGSLLLKSA
ncbi:MAG: SDR family NAD(P)-dependent oxidoreductase, partial [Rickettsiales bacterium]|nr:SDR family NAD(P)-dependent oxidoreductase [Rickettsiales bacterium]